MDELAKTEARNYLSAAGFFLIAASFLLNLFSIIKGNYNSSNIYIIIGIGLLIIATLLIVLKKKDMIAIFFFFLGFYELITAFITHSILNTILVGFILLVALITLTGKDKKKVLLFFIPLIWVIFGIIKACIGFNETLFLTFGIVLTLIPLYFAFCCACERCKLPCAKILTADEQTNFKASGSVLGYLLFAIISGGYVLYYILGDSILPLEFLCTGELISGTLMIFVAILLLAVGNMRFTPIMFLLIGISNILSMYCSGAMWTGIGILFIIIGLFAMLRKESRILPGIMLILYGCTGFFTAYATGTMISAPVVSVILNAIPCLIAIYLSFVVYSQRKLPKF